MCNSECLLVVLSLLCETSQDQLPNFDARLRVTWIPLVRATWRWANENATNKNVVGIYPYWTGQLEIIINIFCCVLFCWCVRLYFSFGYMLEAKTVVKQCRPEKFSVRWRTDFWLELTRTKVEHTYMIARLTRELWSIYSGLPCDFCR